MSKDKDAVVEASSDPGTEAADGGLVEMRSGSGSTVTQVKAKLGKGTISAHVFAVAALLASAGNLVHGNDQQVTHVITRDDSITEAAYEQLRTSIEKQGKQLEATQSDVVALRNFLAGYLQASKPAVAQPRAGASSKAAGDIAKLLPKAGKRPPPPAPPSYQDVKAQAVDESPLQVETKKK